MKRPIAIGLCICENAIVEERTHNLSLINCFTVRRVSSFPSPPQKMAVVGFLVDGFGKVELELRIQHLSSDEEVYHGFESMLFTSPLQEARAVFRFTELILSWPGKYEVSLFANGEGIANHAFHVYPTESP